MGALINQESFVCDDCSLLKQNFNFLKTHKSYELRPIRRMSEDFQGFFHQHQSFFCLDAY